MWVVLSLTTATQLAEKHELVCFIFVYFISYATVLSECLCHGQEILFTLCSTHHVSDVFLEGNVVSLETEFTVFFAFKYPK